MRGKPALARILLWSLLLFSLLTPLAPLPASGQAQAPWEAAGTFNDALFDAQLLLLRGDQHGAQAALDDAYTIYSAHLDQPLRAGAPDAADRVSEALAAAESAVQASDAARLALARGQARAAILTGAAELTIAAAAAGDAAGAQQWLLLREFRPSTRLTRPSAQATVALESLAHGRIAAGAAADTVRADLYDTYQALLAHELAAAVEADDRGAPQARSEAAALAAGYWRLLAPTYEAQRGAAARAEVDAGFTALLQAAPQPVPAGFSAQAELLLTAVRGFRAVPLSTEEQARRATQALSFLALVPIEYARGVHNGQVTLAIEVQEAVTFLAGARAALDDLRPQLEARDPATLATLDATLAELARVLTAANLRESVVEPDTVRELTTTAQRALDRLYPPEWQADAGSNVDFARIETLLDELEAAVAAGQYEQAEALRLEAYAAFDLGPELRLLAFEPDLVAHVDGLFWHGYGEQPGLADAIAEKQSPEAVAAVRVALSAALLEAEQTLGAGPPSAGVVIVNTAIIVFREGLEAVLILAALMAGMIGGYRPFRRPMAWGAVAALGATALTWVAFYLVLEQLRGYGEKLEVVVSLIAIVVLLIILNWFFHNVYWSRWIQRFQGKKRSIFGMSAGQTLGFVLLGFSSVYREGFETTLFLQALVLDAGTQTVLEGVALGVLATAAVGALVFVAHAKLPHRKILIATGVLIAAVLVNMVGTTVHLTQAVGWLPITPIPGLDLPYWAGLWFGLYPSWEGLVLQVAALVFVVGSYFVAERLKNRERQRRVATASAVPSE